MSPPFITTRSYRDDQGRLWYQQIYTSNGQPRGEPYLARGAAKAEAPRPLTPAERAELEAFRAAKAAKETVMVSARVPAPLAARLQAAGEALGSGASAVLRRCLEAGLSEVESVAAAKIKDPDHRARFIAARRLRAAERAAK